MITDKCNGRCVFCNIGRSYNGEDMPPQELVSGIRKTFPKLRKISITGGEPMMYPRVAEVYRNLQEDYVINTVTNGMLPHLVKRFVDVNPNAEITTSLHGVGELHDKCMGIRGAFGRFLKTVDLIPGKTGAGMTVCRLNFDRIVEVHDFLTDMGLYFAVNIMDISELYYQNPDLVGMLPTEKMKKVMIDQMKQVKTVEPLWTKLQIKFLAGERENFDCWSGRSQVFIHNSGRVYPCIYMDKIIESLQLGSLQERSVKQIDLAKCRRCLTHCEAMPSLMISMRRQLFLNRMRFKIRGVS